jgi:hypothetical protein
MEKIRAVEMVRKIRDAHYRATKGKSHEEILRFYRDKAQAFGRLSRGRVQVGR